ncbi:hypothetical protein OIV83_003733 [Microbotryomycetes sp. JL201]|nr:hypothetical protein OIV83_003733 [Microbotryomycetes sp. JL201]
MTSSSSVAAQHHNTAKSSPCQTPVGRPVRARVDPNLFASPGQTTVKVRAAHEASGGGQQPSSAPATPSTAHTPHMHTRPTGTPARASAMTLVKSSPATQRRAASPVAPGSPRKVLGPFAATAAIDDARTSRSPERHSARARAHVFTPIPASSPTITHLPSTVSVRTQSSPALLKRTQSTQPSRAVAHGPTIVRRATDSLSPTPPPLSSSPGSVSADSSVQSPLTSPTLYAQRPNAARPSHDAHADLEKHYSREADGDQDSVHADAIGHAANHDTPTMKRPVRRRTSAGELGNNIGGPLLPPLSLCASTATPRLVGRLSSSSMSSAAASDTNEHLSPRPRAHHTRSHSMASTTSSIFSVSDREAMLSGLGSPPASWGFGHARQTQKLQSRTTSRPSIELPGDEADVQVHAARSSHARTSDIDWQELEGDQNPVQAHNLSVASLQPDRFEAIVADTRRREDQKQRKIDDLEITNKSLLTINTSLERLKSAQNREIRDLRRRLRDMSVLGGATTDGSHMGPAAALAAFRTAEGLPVSPRLVNTSSRFHAEYPFPLCGEDMLEDDIDEDDDSDVEPSWDELLASDLQFSALATVVETLIKRAREAVEWQVDRRLVEGAGRVLSADEVEEKQRLEDQARDFGFESDASR